MRRGARGARRRRTAALTRRRLATPSFQLGRLNHVAVAVPDLAAAAKTWAALGATVSPPQAMPAHGVTACFVGEQLELLEPLGAESPIAAFLERHPAGGLHHVCHEVSDVAAAARDLERRGFRILAPPALGAHGVPVVFLHASGTAGGIGGLSVNVSVEG